MLNAFRHHCCHHRVQTKPAWSVARCSTPFGITAVITRCGTASQWRLRGAQRLSASLLSSLALAATDGSQLRVLNAFRHHCCHHTIDHVGHHAFQVVLNAFRHHCCHHTGTCSKTTAPGQCAQRLSASLLSSHFRSRRSVRNKRVLNAFRHHCCHHATR